MKLTYLFFLSASLALGHVVAPGHNRRLVSRAGQGQQVQDLDGEPDYQDPVTKTTTPKSRILSGVGPDEADKRLFDWDESCTDKDQRAKIVAAFRNVLKLSDNAVTYLKLLEAGFPKQPPGKSQNKQNAKYAWDIDPAFAQYFALADHQIVYIRETFELVSQQVRNDVTTRNGNGDPPALRFICNKDNKVMAADGNTPYCGQPTDPTFAQAIATTQTTKHNIEPKYQFDKASSITFCPPFFDDTQFPSINDREQAPDHSLDKIDCADRILLHEYMHLKWIRDMAPPSDDIGWLKSAQKAKLGWGTLKPNPDNYAWYAMYSYFNNKDQGCGPDVWPSSTKKPVTKPK